MRRWSELAERLAATTRTSEKTALLADYLRTPDPRRAADRGRLPDGPAVRRGRPARRRARLVGHRDDRDRARPASRARRSARPTTARRTSASPSPTSCARAGHAPPPETSPTLPDVAAAFAAIEAASGPASKSAILRDAARAVGPADRQVHRQGPRRRPADRAARGPRRGGHRPRLRPAARRRQVGRDAGRRRRAGWPAWPATTPWRRAALALFHPLKFMLASPAEDAAEIIARLGPEVWVEDKYDGIRAQLHKQGAEVRLYSRDLHDISGRLPGDRRGGPTARLGRHPRRRDPGLARRHGPAVHRAPGSARAQGAVGGDPGRGPGHLRRLRRAGARARAAERRSSRCCACRCASGAPGSTRSTCRWRSTAAGSPARTWSSPPTSTPLEAAFARRARRGATRG